MDFFNKLIIFYLKKKIKLNYHRIKRIILTEAIVGGSTYIIILGIYILFILKTIIKYRSAGLKLIMFDEWIKKNDKLSMNCFCDDFFFIFVKKSKFDGNIL